MDDTLTIDIESTNEANSGIDSLISKLEALKVRVNENLKAIGRLNSALISLGANSKNINFGNVKTPNVPTASPTANATPTAGTTASVPDMSGVVEGQKEVQNALSQTGAEANKAGRSVDDLGNKGNNAGKKVASGAKQGTSALSRLNSMARSALGGVGKIATGAGKGIVTGFVAPTRLAFSIFRSGKKDLGEMGNAVESLSKKLRMTTLALLGARGAFTAIRKSVNAYLQYDTALSETLQNNWAIIGSLIAPILERLIALFSKLVAYIAGFIKMLTGVDLVARANAKALKSQASGAKGASKAVKDLSDELGNLQKFDDLNVVDFPKDKGSSGGSGGGAGLPALKVDKIDMKPLEEFWDFIKRHDWYGLGMEIARKFNDGLRLIDFEWLEQKARQWGKNMGDLFNGLTDGTDWGLVGSKIAGGLNTAMGFVNTFFDTYNFDHLGEGLARGINGLVDTIHWDDVGKYITRKFKALWETLDSLVSNLDFTNLGEGLGTAFESAMLNIDFGRYFAVFGKAFAGLAKTISGFINNVDWATVAKDLSEKLKNGLKEGAKAIQEFDWLQFGDDFANAIKDFFANVDWAGVAESLAEFIGSALGGIIGFLLTAIGNLVTDIVTNIKDYFKQKIDEMGFEDEGANIIAGIFKGILDAIKNIGQWIYNHIFKPFIDGFKKAFGIASPSKVMEEQGGYIIEGFFEGVKGIWDKVKGIFTGLRDNIKNIFTGVKDFIKEKVNDAVTWVKDKFSWGNIKNTFETIKTNIGTKFTNIKDNISSAVTSASNKLKSAFAWDNIKSTFTNIVTKIKNKFGEIGTSVGTILSTKFNQVVSSIVNKAIDVINGFIRAINKAIDAINKIPKVNLKKLDTIDYPKLATGTNNIEVEGLYHLHQGEAVVPKKYNPAINNKMYSENNDKMLAKMDNLIELLNNMEMTNIVNVGNDQLYKGTVQYINRQRDIYGTDVV